MSMLDRSQVKALLSVLMPIFLPLAPRGHCKGCHRSCPRGAPTPCSPPCPSVTLCLLSWLCLYHILASPFQDPNADTEWNDILRKKGILPPKESLKELEEEEEKKEQQLLQQSVGELGPSFPLFCVSWKL